MLKQKIDIFSPSIHPDFPSFFGIFKLLMSSQIAQEPQGLNIFANEGGLDAGSVTVIQMGILRPLPARMDGMIIEMSKVTFIAPPDSRMMV